MNMKREAVTAVMLGPLQCTVGQVWNNLVIWRDEHYCKRLESLYRRSESESSRLKPTEVDVLNCIQWPGHCSLIPIPSPRLYPRLECPLLGSGSLKGASGGRAWNGPSLVTAARRSTSWTLYTWTLNSAAFINLFVQLTSEGGSISFTLRLPLYLRSELKDVFFLHLVSACEAFGDFLPLCFEG